MTVEILARADRLGAPDIRCLGVESKMASEISASAFVLRDSAQSFIFFENFFLALVVIETDRRFIVVFVFPLEATTLGRLHCISQYSLIVRIINWLLLGRKGEANPFVRAHTE